MFLDVLHRYGENTAWPIQGMKGWGGGGGNGMLHLDLIKALKP